MNPTLGVLEMWRYLSLLSPWLYKLKGIKKKKKQDTQTIHTKPYGKSCIDNTDKKDFKEEGSSVIEMKMSRISWRKEPISRRLSGIMLHTKEGMSRWLGRNRGSAFRNGTITLVKRGCRMSTMSTWALRALFSAGTGKLLLASEEGNDTLQQYSLEEDSDEAMQDRVDGE